MSKCPLMSKQLMMNSNGIEYIAPSYVECIKHDCGYWNIEKNRCGQSL